MPQTMHELHSLEAVAKAGNDLASDFKEFGVKQIHPHFDIPPYLVGFRGEAGRANMLIEVICDDVDRDKGLQTAFALAAMECIAVAVTFDAHMATSEINPRTGKEWAKGEMQGLCDGEGACDTGLLTDCLITTAVFATGKTAGYNHSYHFHEAKREIAWVDEEGEVAGSVGFGGYVVDTLREMMEEGRTRSALLMSGSIAQLPSHARALRDAGIIRALSEQSAIVRISRLIAENAKERRIFHKVVTDCDNVAWLR